MIREILGKYYVHSEKGKKLSKGYKSRKAAKERLREIEYFKYKNKKGGN
jgi:hypothetical protein